MRRKLKQIINEGNAIIAAKDNKIADLEKQLKFFQDAHADHIWKTQHPIPTIKLTSDIVSRMFGVITELKKLSKPEPVLPKLETGGLVFKARHVLGHDVDDDFIKKTQDLNTVLRGAIRDKIKLPKPPLGLMPKDKHREMRLQEIKDAMHRYLDAGKAIPQEWTDEYNELVNR